MKFHGSTSHSARLQYVDSTRLIRQHRACLINCVGQSQFAVCILVVCGYRWFGSKKRRDPRIRSMRRFQVSNSIGSSSEMLFSDFFWSSINLFPTTLQEEIEAFGRKFVHGRLSSARDRDRLFRYCDQRSFFLIALSKRHPKVRDFQKEFGWSRFYHLVGWLALFGVPGTNITIAPRTAQNAAQCQPSHSIVRLST